MKLAGILLLIIGGLLMLCVPVSMWWTYQQIANSPSSPAPADLADGISQSVVFGLLALPVGLLGLVLLLLGIVSEPKQSKHGDPLDEGP